MPLPLFMIFLILLTFMVMTLLSTIALMRSPEALNAKRLRVGTILHFIFASTLLCLVPFHVIDMGGGDPEILQRDWATTVMSISLVLYMASIVTNLMCLVKAMQNERSLN